MTDDLLKFGIAKIKEYGIITGGEATKNGLLTMSDARWKKTTEFMVQAGLLKAKTDYRQAYTLDLIRDVKVLP